MAWITTDDVRAALGLDPADTDDDAWLVLVTDAANAQAFAWRHAWGYVDDPGVLPTDHAVKLGTIQYAVRRYHERGTGGSFAGSLDGASLPSIRGIWSDLGGPRPRVDRPPVDPAAPEWWPSFGWRP